MKENLYFYLIICWIVSWRSPFEMVWALSGKKCDALWSSWGLKQVHWFDQCERTKAQALYDYKGGLKGSLFHI